MLRTTLLTIAVLTATALAAPAPAHAQGYIEKKDNDALGVMERALAKVDVDRALFDGTAIPRGADLRKVGELLHRLHDQLDLANRSYNELSATGQARGKALLERWKQLAAYHDALVPVYAAAAAAAESAAAQQAADDDAARTRGLAACKGFRDALSEERSELQYAAQIVAGSGGYWQDVDAAAKHRAALAKAAAVCARPEYADIGRACGYMTYGADHPEADWCAAAAQGDAVLKQAARNLAAFHAAHFGAGRTAEQLAGLDGWVDVEGPVTWAEYFSGQKLRAVLMKRLAPIFAQAGLTSVDDLPVFAELDAHYAALAAKVTELAPTWDLPGRACGGPGCSAAKKTAAAWYPKAKLRRVLESERGWTVVQNDLGLVTHRWKGGFVLLEVKGDPLCQLRSWTVTENYQGGGRYQAATGAEIGYVRWQPCK